MNRKGSSSVFLVMILTCMIAVTFGFIGAAERVAAISCGDSLLQLAGRSVLSEYDVHLKKYYGLFAFRGQQPEINSEISQYVDYALDGRKKIKMTAVSSDTSEYSLANTESFEKEIIEYTKFAIARGIIKDAVPGSGGSEGKQVNKEESERVLRSSSIIDSLPSGAVSGNENLVERIKGMLDRSENVFQKGSRDFLVNRYIMEKYKNAQNQDIGRGTFFKYEAEYILEGSMDDNLNRKKFRQQVIALRNAVNLAFIYTDPVKRAELIAAAELIAPGPAGLAAQLLLAEGWALAEAENDMQILEHGKKVPVYKTAGSWAVDLESVVKNKTGEYIDTGSGTGMTYSGYLQLFLFFQDRTVKYGRMMDLMQINIQGTEDSTFLIREHNTGVRMSADINGRKYSYDQEY